MRNKIKQLLKKEGGFTLVELLAVLAILALIVGIAVPMIGNVMTKAETSASASEIELIIDAAQMYQLSEEKVTFPVSTDDLVDKGYLEKDAKLDGKQVSFDETTKKFTVTPVAKTNP
ncbi:prepilin-type N-terminal cleavage/methylation domain-containing protein [Jeotgalibaca porci]|uniref:prepilin-type N-terminal cleavage/methylation domain-containing protein n=1 Tax=Jeotgalibaca porci TaxID=1868793 RepID=UPI00359FDCF5